MNNKKNIAFFLHSFPEISETFILNQIITLIDEGHNVDIYSLNEPGSKTIHPLVKDYRLHEKVIYLNRISVSRRRNILMLFRAVFFCLSLTNIRKVFRFIRRGMKIEDRTISLYHVLYFIGKPDYDVMHAHYGPVGNFMVRLQEFGIFNNAKLVTTFHGFDFKLPQPGFYDRLFRDCDVFTVNTEYSKGRLQALGCPSHKISILPVGIISRQFQQTWEMARKTARLFTIIFIGRLVAFKAPDIFVDVCDLLKTKYGLSFKAIMIGSGEKDQAIRELINSKGLDADIKMMGFMTSEKVINHLSNSDVFVLTGRNDDGHVETQGLVVQEAQMAGVPVVVANIGGISEGIINEITGFCVTSDDKDSFAKCIFDLSKNPERCSKMGAAGREFVLRNYDSIILNQKLLEIYES